MTKAERARFEAEALDVVIEYRRQLAMCGHSTDPYTLTNRYGGHHQGLTDLIIGALRAATAAERERIELCIDGEVHDPNVRQDLLASIRTPSPAEDSQ